LTKTKLKHTIKEHSGALNFATDAWTSPNNKAYVAVTVHFEQNGIPICLLLDVVEVACSHTGENLAIAFADILKDYEIGDKVRYCYKLKQLYCTHLLPTDPVRYL
jgi:hypothetical protein